MKILSINALIPPAKLGGAEESALNCARQLSNLGHQVEMLGAHPDASRPTIVGSVEHRGSSIRTIQLYSSSIENIAGAAQFEKVRMHGYELCSKDFANRAMDEISSLQPDCILVQNTQGIGSGIFSAIGRADIPCVHILHDQALACLNRGFFRGGKQCEGWCLPCRVTSPIKVSQLKTVRRLSLVSPSRFNLDAVGRHCDIGHITQYALPNPNQYPVFPRVCDPTAKPRLLYVGRLAAEKGVETAIHVASELAKSREVGLDILGGGPLRSTLEAEAAKSGGDIRFLGYVDQVTVGKFMSRAALLLLPSLWQENFPGVAVHALQAGLPVIASHMGGIPEIVTDGVEGRLLPPRDVGMWVSAVEALRSSPAMLEAMSSNAVAKGKTFEAAHIARKLERIIIETIAQ